MQKDVQMYYKSNSFCTERAPLTTHSVTEVSSRHTNCFFLSVDKRVISSLSAFISSSLYWKSRTVNLSHTAERWLSAFTEMSIIKHLLHTRPQNMFRTHSRAQPQPTSILMSHLSIYGAFITKGNICHSEKTQSWIGWSVSSATRTISFRH